jgi:hypothetical protein
MPVLTFARYILEMSLLDYNFNVETSESLLAAAALALTLKIRGITDWTDTLQVVKTIVAYQTHEKIPFFQAPL